VQTNANKSGLKDEGAMGRATAFINRFLSPLSLRLIRVSTSDAQQENSVGRLRKLDDSQSIMPHRESKQNYDAKFAYFKQVVQRPISLLILGSAGDSLILPEDIADITTVVKFDARESADGLEAANIINIKGVVSDVSGDVVFIERSQGSCSSLLLPNPKLVRDYDLGKNFVETKRIIVNAATINDVAGRSGINSWHYIKTDIEGMDFAVIKSIGDNIRNTVVLQMELRFEPFFMGEPFFHEVVSYLANYGFEVLDLRAERWRYKTKNMPYSSKGRATFCNVIFVNVGPLKPEITLVQALILGLLGYSNYAEYILENRPDIELEARNELVEFLFSKMHLNDRFLPYPKFPHVIEGAE
jgi:FkbM family methyltransferase